MESFKLSGDKISYTIFYRLARNTRCPFLVGSHKIYPRHVYTILMPFWILFSGNQPSKDTIHRYRSTWGDDYFSFWTHGCLFIVLNSQLYEDCSLTEDLASEQDEWLDQVLLETEKAKYTFVFQHIPWFLKTPDEDKEYFNIETGLRMKMLNKFYDAGVSKIFCGHYHRNTGGLWFFITHNFFLTLNVRESWD